MEEKNDDDKYEIFSYPNKIRIKLAAYRNIFGLFSIFSTLFTNISIAIVALLNGLTLFQGIILIIGFFIMMMSVQFYNAAFDISDVKIRHRIIKKWFQSITYTRTFEKKIFLNMGILITVLGTLAGVWYFDTDIKKGEITEGSFISEYPAYLDFYTNVYPAINNTILVNVSYWLEYAIVNYTKSQLSFWNDYEQNVTAHAIEIIYLLLFISGVIMFIILMGLYLASYYYLTIEPDIANLEKPELALLLLSNHANELKDELEKNNCEIHYE